MAKFFLSARRILLSPFPTSPSKLFSLHSLCSEAFRSIEEINGSSTPTNHRRYLIQLPPMIPTAGNHLEKGFHIELVDSDLWGVSFGLAHSWNGTDGKLEASIPSPELVPDGCSDCSPVVGEEDNPDFDEIEDLRLRKKLFYKLDKGSKEFEENNFIFHRRKSSKKKKTREKLTQADRKQECKKSEKKMDDIKVSKQKAKNLNQESERARIEAPVMEGKKVRTPTFNQLTDPYHLPFCLDIYISKGSVRACVVHRVTSKVVAVAHSISKDMKFDLTSKKDAKACAAVGKVLAKRAIEDDIYNVVYTPRKGEKIEGKIQIVLQSIIDHGVDVKVKLKQKSPKKVGGFLAATGGEESANLGITFGKQFRQTEIGGLFETRKITGKGQTLKTNLTCPIVVKEPNHQMMAKSD